MMENHNNLVESLLDKLNRDLIEKSTTKSHEELFDKHPISEIYEFDLACTDKRIFVTDNWKPEWCRDGVQVPINSANNQKKPEYFKLLNLTGDFKRKFKLPDKLLRSTKNHLFDSSKHIKVNDNRIQYLYEIDSFDIDWLNMVNMERSCLKLSLITKKCIEIVFELSERMAYKQIQSRIREAETEFLEHDENSKCDVCQCPEGEDGNELVFCEDCFVCVHQACYGIPELPAGNWICRHCEKCPNLSSKCILCPNKGGAMKLVESEEEKWAHISCAVWIPELAFGSIEYMEPITKLSCIPPARWNLKCHLCKIANTGAPIQCSDRKCKLAFHVTCAVKHNLHMNQEFEDNMEVKLLAYCKNHSKKFQTNTEEEIAISDGPRDIKELRVQKRRHWESKFTELVKLTDLTDPLFEHPTHLAEQLGEIPKEIIEKVFLYWTLKRTSNNWIGLIVPPDSWSEQHQQQRLTNRSVLRAFRNIRFGLDRTRLILDMLVRREKKKSQHFTIMSKISKLQLQHLRNCRQNSILKDDASLSANWGYISSAHLDTNIYSNPSNLINPNFQYVIDNLISTHQIDKQSKLVQSFTQTQQNSNISSQRKSKMLEKFKHNSNSSDHQTSTTVIDSSFIEQKDLQWSCVSSIPDCQLKLRGHILSKLNDRINDSSQARCQYLNAHSAQITLSNIPSNGYIHNSPDDRKENRTPKYFDNSDDDNIVLIVDDDDNNNNTISVPNRMLPTTDSVIAAVSSHNTTTIDKSNSSSPNKRRRISSTSTRFSTDFIVNTSSKRNLFEELMKPK